MTIHVPYSPATHHLIGKRELEQMKPTAILINASRGGVVDDAALIEALRSGMIAGAGLDVFENEPKFDPGFLPLKNVVLAPHIASSFRSHTSQDGDAGSPEPGCCPHRGKPPNLLNPF